MKILKYQIENILDHPRIKELFKMKCFRVDDHSWLDGCDFSSETQTFMNLRNTPETQFDDTFFIVVENCQREYRTFDENDEVIEYDIGEILVGDYTSLIITEIEWITRQSKELGFKKIYELNEACKQTAGYTDEPPY